MHALERIRELTAGLAQPELTWGVCEHERAGPGGRIEERSMERVVASRRQAFRAGRTAAREALAAAGLPLPAEIPTGPHRAPQWPPGVLGSISHSRGLSVACIARSEHVAALGIDLELRRSLTPELWPVICTPDEIELLASLDADRALEHATSLFSAKESLFKLQFPLTGLFVDFLEAEVTLAPGRFEASLPAEVHDTLASPAPIRGRMATSTEFVLTAACLLRS